MPNFETVIAGVKFKNPLIGAAGLFGNGEQYADFWPLTALGGLVTGSYTSEPREGFPPPRFAETASGIVASAGYPNPGLDAFIKRDLPRIAAQDVVGIVSIAASVDTVYGDMAEKLESTRAGMIELNLAAGNQYEGGAPFSSSFSTAAKVTRIVRRYTTKPLIVKLAPAALNIAEIARAVESEGADAIALISGLPAMRIDIATRRPIIASNVGSLSGPAIFPMALHMVWQAVAAVNLPIIGCGGISTAEDAIEMMMAGAMAVEIGSAVLHDPNAPIKILAGLERYLKDNRLSDINNVVGVVRPWRREAMRS